MSQAVWAWLFGNSVPNDGGIMPIERVREKIYDKAVLATYCMSQIDGSFAKKVRENDFIVAGSGFGVGQLHVQGPLSIIGLRLGVLSESMTRPFFRISASVGLRMLPFAKNIKELVNDGDRLEVDYRTGEVKKDRKSTRLNSSH